MFSQPVQYRETLQHTDKDNTQSLHEYIQCRDLKDEYGELEPTRKGTLIMDRFSLTRSQDGQQDHIRTLAGNAVMSCRPCNCDLILHE